MTNRPSHWKRVLTISSLAILAVFVLFFYRSLRQYIGLARLAVTMDSEICSRIEVFEGLGDVQTTALAVARARETCRLMRRDKQGLQLWSTPIGELWFPSSSEPEIVYFAIAQYMVDPYPRTPIRQGDVVLDCGGFVGDWTRLALSKGASLVVAVEPSREARECLRRNLSEQVRDGRVIVCEKGIWDKEDSLYLRMDPGNHQIF